MIPQKIRDLGFTDEEVIALIREVAWKIAPSYKFGYYDDEDIVQEAVIIGLEGLEDFSAKTGTLESFLLVHISNRMKNFKRDNYFRPDTKNSIDKIAVMNPVDITSVNAERENNMLDMNDLEENLTYKDMIQKINKELPVDFRRDYLKIVDGLGTSMTARRRKEVINKIKEIVGHG